MKRRERVSQRLWFQCLLHHLHTSRSRPQLQPAFNTERAQGASTMWMEMRKI